MNTKPDQDRKPPTQARSTAFKDLFAKALAFAASASFATLTAHAATSSQDNSGSAEPNGPIRLIQTNRPTPDTNNEQTQQQYIQQVPPNGLSQPANPQTPRTRQMQTPSEPPNEFELYLQRVLGEDINIRRFGAELLSPSTEHPAPFPTPETNSHIPQDYLIGVGDEVLLTAWGSIDADLRLQVDRSGRIHIPRVGPVLVAGVKYGDLNATVEQRVAQVFRNFKLTTSLGRLRSIRVYITGFCKRPGAYTVSSLSTLVNALMQAGGPSGSGSFRSIQLKRKGKAASNFDFYDFLIKGDQSADVLLQADDVIHIDAVGTQVALIGSVNKPAIFELAPGESVADLLRIAGGFTALADRSRLTVEQLDARNETRIRELILPTDNKYKPQTGDLLRAFSAVDTTLPQFKQNKRVRVEGEVHKPGDYILPPNSTFNDAIKAAGGLTTSAYIFGTDFSRETVRIAQQENYDRALRDLETEFTRSTSTQKALTAEDAATQAAKAQGSSRLIERLRAVKPTGRVVLQINPKSPTLPDLPLEDGDRILIPARPTTIGVFGSVFNAGSFLYADGASVSDFLRLAGGPTRGADVNSAFVLRANGSVISSRQKSGWIIGGGNLEGISAEPGDTVFVPEELNKTTFVQEAKEWTQILYQFGIGAAALKTIKN